MEFKPQEHVIVMERKAKKKDAQGRESWEVTKTEYLPVQWRIFWFRQDNPKGKIDSHALTLDLERGAAIFETYVEREDGGSARMHGSETAGDWKDYIEKAQTKSLGRALAAVGYGSQFTDDEFTEGERIVDSPVARGEKSADQTLHDLGKPGSYEQHEAQANGHQEPEPQSSIPSVKQLQARCTKLCGAGYWQAMLKVALKLDKELLDKDITIAQRISIHKYLEYVDANRPATP